MHFAELPTEKTNPVRTRIIQSIKDNLFARMRGDLFSKTSRRNRNRRDELHAQMDKDFSILTETMLGEFQNQIDSFTPISTVWRIFMTIKGQQPRQSLNASNL